MENNNYTVKDAYGFINFDMPVAELTMKHTLKTISPEAFERIRLQMDKMLNDMSFGDKKVILDSTYGMMTSSQIVCNMYGSMWRIPKSLIGISLYKRHIENMFNQNMNKMNLLSTKPVLECVLHSFYSEPSFEIPDGTCHIVCIDYVVHRTFLPKIDIHDYKCKMSIIHLMYGSNSMRYIDERFYKPDVGDNDKHVLERTIKKGRVKGGSNKRG